MPEYTTFLTCFLFLDAPSTPLTSYVRLPLTLLCVILSLLLLMLLLWFCLPDRDMLVLAFVLPSLLLASIFSESWTLFQSFDSIGFSFDFSAIFASEITEIDTFFEDLGVPGVVGCNGGFGGLFGTSSYLPSPPWSRRLKSGFVYGTCTFTF